MGWTVSRTLPGVGRLGDVVGLGVRAVTVRRFGAVRTAVDSKMSSFSRYESVRKFTLIPEEFTQEKGELTPTLKLKRRALLSRYAAVIDGMYADANGEAWV